MLLIRTIAVAVLSTAAACSSGTTSARDAGPRDDDAAPTSTNPDARPGNADAAPMMGAPDAADDTPDAEPDAGFDLTRDPGCPQSAAWVVLLHGLLRDQAGAPLPSAKAQMCIHTANDDMFYCIRPADTRADGTFTVAVPDNARCMRDAAMRFLAPHTPRGATYCKLDLGTQPELTVADPFALFDTQPPRTLPPLGDENVERTVVFDDGMELDIIPFNYFAEYTALTAGRVPLNHGSLCFLEGQAPFDGLYTFAPESDIAGRAPVRVPNTTMLAANTLVHVFVLGSLDCMLDDMTFVPEAEWVEVGTGRVTADGRMVDIPSGLPCLSWFAYRAD